MDREFVTATGSVAFTSNRLVIKNFKFNFWRTAVGEMVLPVFILSIAFFSFFNRSKAFSYIATAIFIALFFSTSFNQLYTALFKKSYSNCILLSRIKSIELKPDELGLKTEVRVYLKNGRYRSIIFRTLEKQYEPFAEQLSPCLVQPQIA